MLLVVLLVIGGVLGHLQTTARTAGKVDIPSRIIQTMTDPVAMPLAHGLIALDEFSSGVLRARSLVVENERLKSQMVGYAAYTEQVDVLRQELAQLRSQLGLPSKNRTPVNLDVIGISPGDGWLILDGGSETGIRPDLPVVNGDGLVGIIKTVSKGQCQAALLTGYGVKVAGIDSTRQPPEAGLLSGSGSSTLTMLMYAPKAPVMSGDAIMTGGQSLNIPGGLVIGHVISVQEDESSGTKRLTIDPAVNLGLVHEVQVLK